MLKKDPIFWCASGIFILAILLFAVAQNQLWLALMVGSYLLRPTLASLGVARRLVDERQMSLQYRSSNIAFAVMIIICIILAVKLNAEGNHDWEMFNLAIIVGLAAKALFNVILVKNYREAGAKIIMAAGLLIFLFVALENGFSAGTLVEGAPGLAIVGIGLLAKKFPKAVGVTIVVVAAVMVLRVLSVGLTLSQIFVALLISVPLVAAGVCLIVGNRGETDKVGKELSTDKLKTAEQMTQEWKKKGKE